MFAFDGVSSGSVNRAGSVRGNHEFCGSRHVIRIRARTIAAPRSGVINGPAAVRDMRTPLDLRRYDER